jgi:plastocyanin
MRFFGFTVAAASVFALAACGGGEKQATNDNAAADTASASASAAAPEGTATFAPITGTIHTVRMVGDEKGYYYDPAEITVKVGDGIKYVNVSGGPHNVAFDPASLPADVRAQLAANMPNTISELTSPMFITPNEEYTISFGNIKPGTYVAHCTPHLAMNMKQTIKVVE